MILEVQIAQEYTGQQIDLCYLVPMWKEILGFDTYGDGEGTTVEKVVSGGELPAGQLWYGWRDKYGR